MHYAIILAAVVATSIASPADLRSGVQVLSTIELGEGNTKTVTQAEKLALIKNGTTFLDITAWPQSYARPPKAEVEYPTEMTQGDTVQALIKEIGVAHMNNMMLRLVTYKNRYMFSDTGVQSSNLLFHQAQAYIPEGSPATVAFFNHSWPQNSVIATIPGLSEQTIVVGAHQDSINNNEDPETGRAPGADDNASGSVTILEAFRVILTNDTIASGNAPYTLEFHWYAGEEEGALGSMDIFESYAQAGRDIIGMLNQDMTGFTEGYKAANMTPKFGIIMDNTDPALTDFTRLIIDEYTELEGVDTECGYGCSDHSSATRAGYPSAFIFEGEMRTVNDNPYVHSSEDTMDHVDFEHVLEHAKLVVGLVVELAFAVL